jgi:release factor glutamine methyltransferase
MSNSDNQTEAWNIQRLLEWTTEYFQKVDAETPRLEAEVLLAEALDCQRIELYTRFAEVPESEPVTKYRDWVKRRAAGEPVAYIVGHREFYSLKFAVNSSVLIPRPETEHVVVAAIEACQQVEDRPIRILDVGTGSGCIAVALAKHIENVKIGAIDLSPDAIEVARQNIDQHEVADRVKCFTGDLLQALPAGSQPVHVIVSNPPYIGSNEQGTVEPNVDQFEPAMALYGGAEGTEVIERLISQSIDFLLPGGFLIFETSPIIMDACIDLVSGCDQFSSCDVLKDYSGHRRVVVARRV